MSDDATRSIIERVTDAFVSLNDVWQFTYVNAKAGEIFGRPPEELLGKHLWSEFPQRVGQTSRHACYQALADQVPAFVEEFHPSSNRWYEYRIYPSKDGLSIFFTDITERRRLEENQARLGAVLDATPDLVGFADGAGTLLYLNSAGRRMLAVPEGKSSPGAIVQFLPARVERRYVDEWLPSVASTGSWHGDATLRTADGSELSVSLSLIAHRKQDGDIDFISILARDLSPLRRHESRLQESEARYRTIVENAPEAVVVLDLESLRFVDFNENALKLFGLSREQMLSTGPVELSPPLQPDGRPSSDAAREKIEDAVRGGRPVFEWIHRNSRGAEFPCEVRLVRIPSGDAVLVRGSILDISERKRAEESLRESEARFRQIAETIHDVFWIGSSDLKEFLYVSPAFEDIWGRSRKELYRSAETWNDVIHPDDGGP